METQAPGVVFKKVSAQDQDKVRNFRYFIFLFPVSEFVMQFLAHIAFNPLKPHDA